MTITIFSCFKNVLRKVEKRIDVYGEFVKKDPDYDRYYWNCEYSRPTLRCFFRAVRNAASRDRRVGPFSWTAAFLSPGRVQKTVVQESGPTRRFQGISVPFSRLIFSARNKIRNPMLIERLQSPLNFHFQYERTETTSEYCGCLSVRDCVCVCLSLTSPRGVHDRCLTSPWFSVFWTIASLEALAVLVAVKCLLPASTTTSSSSCVSLMCRV